jgi:alpha-L-rhamnosidase
MRPCFLAVVMVAAFSAYAFAADSPVRVGALSAEHSVNPIGIGATRPRLSWKLISDRRDEMQSAYEIRAASSKDKLEQADLWSSGKVKSDQSSLVSYAGKPLGSRAQVFWQVRVWDKDDKASDWSEPASIELGLLDPARDWKAQWITSEQPRVDIYANALAKASWISGAGQANQPAGVRLAFDLPADAKVQAATIHIAANGLIALWVNGSANRQGSSSHTGPFIASFGPQLQAGKNVIAIQSGPARGGRGRGGTARNGIAAHVAVELEGGKHLEFDTDATWKAASAPQGEWFAPNADEAGFAAATVHEAYSAAPLTGSSDSMIGPGRYLRKSFTVKGPIAKARLYATALGTYDASINGKPVSEDRMAPGWTDYLKRVMVQTYDVTALLQPGQNALGAVLTDGWFAGRLGWMGAMQYAQISRVPVFAAQLEITYADGTSETIATDTSWKTGPGAIVGSDQQIGEIIDHRQAAPFDEASFSDSSFTAAQVHEIRPIALDPQLGPPVRKIAEIKPAKITRHGETWVIDLGQNIVGHVRLRARGEAGTNIIVRHAEMLNADGSLYTENLRPAISVDTFILKGGGEEIFEPRFTFHGFQYVEVTNYPGTLGADDITGIVVGSDTPQVGTFETANSDVNRLFQNILWGQRGNFLSVPTDCPQRDERMGWMGDAQVFAPTAAYNADVAGFFTKWMVDVNDGQTERGDFSDVSPRVARPGEGWPVWGDAGVIIPWVMYQTYGDASFLETNYEHMKRWIDFNKQRSNDLLLSGGVGDHLAPTRGVPGAARGNAPTTNRANRANRGGGGAPPVSTTSVVDTAYFAHAARLVSRTAALLNKVEESQAYEKLANDIKAAFNRAYVQEDGTIRAGTQTTYILALHFDLLPETLRAAAVQNLVKDIEQRGHLSTGFVGVGLINPTLTEIGRVDVAYKLLLNDTYPSWLFTVKQGATTIWERWDGYTPQSGFQDSSMNSFNHYSLGSVGYWLYSDVGGIKSDGPGFKRIVIKPQPNRQLGYAKTSYASPYGTISTNWKYEGETLTMDVTIPPNTTAMIYVPSSDPASVKESGGLAASSPEAATAVFKAGSGQYHFTARQ